jgi:hypothetical protein
VSDIDERRLRRLFARSDQAAYELDLSGLDLPHALASLDRMVERQRFRPEPRNVVVRLDPASATSGPTLFQPVGRALLSFLRQGLVTTCRPLPAESGAGFYVEMPGKKPTS